MVFSEHSSIVAASVWVFQCANLSLKGSSYISTHSAKVRIVLIVSNFIASRQQVRTHLVKVLIVLIRLARAVSISIPLPGLHTILDQVAQRGATTLLSAPTLGFLPGRRSLVPLDHSHTVSTPFFFLILHRKVLYLLF